jgi:hypothetical protein
LFVTPMSAERRRRILHRLARTTPSPVSRGHISARSRR